MSTANSNKLKSKLKSMSTPKKRRKRTVNRAPAKRRTTTRRRPTKKRALSSGGGGTKKPTIMKAAGTALGGAAGGGLYLAPQFLIKMPLWAKALYGFGGAVAAAKFGFPSVGAGMAGGMAVDAGKQFLSTALKDADYVDADTLSDTGYRDQNGNAVVMDDNGDVFALNDDGEYQFIGEADDLLEDDTTDMQSVSMIPLQDENPYNLNDAYMLASGY